MEKDNLKNILIALLIGFIFVVASIIYMNCHNELSDKKEIKLNEAFQKEQMFKQLKITDIKANRKNNQYHLRFKITNKKDQKFSARKIKINFYKNNKVQIGQLEFYLTEIEANKSVDVDIILKPEWLKAYSFKLK